MLIWKFEAIRAVNGGPKINQIANAVTKSIQNRINSLCLLDKLLNKESIVSIQQFYFKKSFVYILLILVNKIIIIIKNKGYI